MREKLEAAIPTALFSFGQRIQMRVDELISGIRAALAIKVYGEDLGELSKLAEQVKDVLASVKGAKDVQVETLLGKPTVTLQVDRAAAARFGLNVADVLEVVRAGIGGEVVSTIIDGPRRYEVVVRFDEASRRDVTDILRIPVRTPEGNIVPLSRVAEAVVTSGVAKVRRESLSRLIVVQANVEGRDVGGFVAEAQERITKAVKFPPGYYTDWGGAFENQRRAMRTLSIIVPLTIALILVLLYTAFQSMRHALLIISGVPFSVVGGDPRAARLRPEPLGAGRDRLHRRLRRGHAERRGPRRVPGPAPRGRPAAPGGRAPGLRPSAQARAHDGDGHHPRPRPAVDRARDRGGGAAATRHGRRGRALHVHLLTLFVLPILYLMLESRQERRASAALGRPADA